MRLTPAKDGGAALRDCSPRAFAGNSDDCYKYARHSCPQRASDPQYLSENVLKRQFCAEKPNEKCLTHVTEFKYYVGPSVHKLYLSAILDLCDRRIVFQSAKSLAGKVTHSQGGGYHMFYGVDKNVAAQLLCKSSSRKRTKKTAQKNIENSKQLCYDIG